MHVNNMPELINKYLGWVLERVAMDPLDLQL
jgi:hypothetical protein